MLKLTNIVLKCSRQPAVTQNLLRFSSTTVSELKELPGTANKPESFKNQNSALQQPNSGMVAAAFAALQTEEANIKTPRTDERVLNAKTVNDLLAISEGSGVSRKHALKVVSILSEWCNNGKAELSEFETDPRFIKLCKVLARPAPGIKYSRTTYNTQSEDLTTVMSIKADDEAAKLVGSITTIQMVKVLTTLAQKKRRSMSLLRALAYNIAGSHDKLNVKLCADVLYSVAALNFFDPNLLEKVCIDICFSMQADIKKSSVIGSILTSLGLLKYKDIGVLDTLSEWLLKNFEKSRPQDIYALVQTLAVLNHQPSNAEQLFAMLPSHLSANDTENPSEWLDLVWSLVLLKLATNDQVNSVLSEAFVNKVLGTNQANQISSKLRLLNIDAYATHLLADYQGPRLNDEIRKCEIPRNKGKEDLVAAVLDTLKNLMNFATCVKTDVNTGMGFLIDAVCFLDKRGQVIPLDKADLSGENQKVAIIVYDYHDMCQGRSEPTGVNIFASGLLQAQKYRVVTIPYLEFRPRDKLIRRVQYIEAKLKQIVQN